MNPQTYAERCANLAKGNAVRTARAELKVELREGVRTLPEILRADEDFIQTMKLVDLLKACRGMGKIKASRALIGCQISGSAPVRNVTMGRREQLLTWLAAHRKAQIVPAIEAESWGAKGGYR